MACALNAVKPDTFELSGEFDADQLPALVAEGEKLIAAQSGQTLYIDLASWAHAKSTVLSLLLAWLRCAKKHQVKLVYLNPPVALVGLAQVSSLDKILFSHALSGAE
jgi:ABC-type transporter Mla MlaB component